MKHYSKIILAIMVLALAALACQIVMGGGSTPAVPPAIITEVFPTALPTEAQASTGNVILSDDFSIPQWGVRTDDKSSVEYANEALQMIVYEKNYFVWSTPPNNENYQNVHLEVTVINNETDERTAFGLMCNQQAESESFYYFAITPAGQYAIAKAVKGQTDVFLTNNDEYAVSDLISKNASSYRVGADCGNGTLTLYVDGRQIALVSDSTYTNGGIGVFAWSDIETTSTNVSFDDFVMTELP